MDPKKAFADYFTFSKKDRLAVFLFIAIVGGLLFVPTFLPDRPPALAPIPDSLLRRSTPLPDSPGRYQRRDDFSYKYHSDRAQGSAHEDRDAWKRAAPFPFDPNSLDAAGWTRLGLPERTIGTILKYRERGGRFRRPEDLGKIWSLPPGFVERVLPFVRIEGEAVARPAGAPAYPGRLVTERKARSQVILSINEADSASWESLPGIGAKLAGRILRFRERLGGFTSVEQVGETFGLPDSSFRLIRPLLQLNFNKEAVRKINLNAATKEELKAHPYIRWALANAIVEYRQRHGPFASPEDLRKLLIMPDSVYRKLQPYVTVN